MPKLTIEKVLFLFAMTEQLSKLPPFLLEHFAANRPTKAQLALTLVQKEITPKKVHTSSWKQRVETTDKTELGSALQELGLTGATLRYLLATYSQAELLSAITFVKHTAKKQTIRSKSGFFLKTITHGWDLKKPSKGRKIQKSLPAANIIIFTDNIATLEEDPLCKTLRRSLCQKIGSPDYLSWFAPTSWKIDGTKLIIATPSAFILSQLSLRFKHLIQQILHAEDHQIQDCTFVRS